MFKDINAFKRESYGRHKSERMLDNNLYKFHKKTINEKNQKLRKIGANIPKKEENVKIEPKQEENKEKRELNIELALKKILPHLDSKFCKSLKMISKLIKIGIKKFDESLILGILLELYDRVDMLEVEEDFKYMRSCFDLVKLYEKILLKSPESEDIFKILCLPCSTYLELRETDDSFAFNNIVQEVKDEFFRFHDLVTISKEFTFPDAMGVKMESDEIKEEDEEPEDVIEKVKKRALKILGNKFDLMNLKRLSYINFISLAIKQAKVKKWSEMIIFNFVKEIFFNKDFVYNDEQKEKLGDLMEKMHILKNQRNIKNKHLVYRDGKILGNPLNSYHEVKDNREWQLSMDGLEKWGYKQMGL